ncbi:LysE family translocator [Kushneria aurantia]|uniref:LysE family translocator n=1 Tax=Kushneria aurantia TaxID=504092 RepID=A0ABV6G0H4_9GAMM|nr:LysE family translocator [Kushneria aurantia]
MLSSGWLLSVILFAISATGTPGPNNVMLTASGARYGYRRTLPHIFGILLGGLVLFTALALGLGVLFERYPAVQNILKVAGALYLLYLAWKIASAPPPQLEHQGDAKPLTLWQAALFQFVNPKVWVMGLALMAGFLPSEGSPLLNALMLAFLIELVAFPCISMWAGFGTVIARFLETPRAWRIFNVVMGSMTAACVLFIVG